MSVADKIDLLYEAFGEIQKGNPEPLFLDIYKEALASILTFSELASVCYFRDTILPEIIQDSESVPTNLRLITAELVTHSSKSDT